MAIESFDVTTKRKIILGNAAAMFEVVNAHIV